MSAFDLSSVGLVSQTLLGIRLDQSLSSVFDWLHSNLNKTEHDSTSLVLTIQYSSYRCVYWYDVSEPVCKSVCVCVFAVRPASHGQPIVFNPNEQPSRSLLWLMNAVVCDVDANITLGLGLSIVAHFKP